MTNKLGKLVLEENWNYPDGGMYVCTKCHDNPSNSCPDICLKTANVNFLVGLQEKSGDHQIKQDSSSGDHACLYKNDGNQFKLLFYFKHFSLAQSGGSTNTAVPIAMLLKMNRLPTAAY